jgi:8-oxo-dGTP pyrophosphatase MutT (NUDIX family)
LNNVRRGSARVLLVDGNDKLLLFRYLRDPAQPGLGTLWVIPGGGIEEGEQAVEAAARELFEETGLSARPDDLGPVVAVRSGLADLGWGELEFHDSFFFYRVNSHHVDIGGFEEIESRSFFEYRWWSLNELAETTQTVYPDGLVALLSDLLKGKRPGEPVRLPWDD